MARLTGMSVSGYGRLERNKTPGNINFRELVNCALVLRVDVEDLIEDEWRAWWVFDARRPTPPN